MSGFIEILGEDGSAQLYSDDKHSHKVGELYFESWRLSVETNNVGLEPIPEIYVESVKEYMNGERYETDSKIISDYALKYATKLEIARDGKDAWIFDVDETLISNLGYFDIHGYGSAVDPKAIDEWNESAKATALRASLWLYTKLQQLGFKIFVLSSRHEEQRECTEKNLKNVGFTNYEKLILRGDSDASKNFKSEKRQELVDEGYIIHGNCGDQWSDLLGFATATRSFKLPNPLYYVP